MSSIQLDLSRQRLYLSPDDPLPEFYPTPRAILVTPIYDTPISENGSSSLSEHSKLQDLNQASPTRPWIVNSSSEQVVANPEPYQDSSSRRRDDRPYAYSTARDQRYDPDPSYYAEYPDRSRRRSSDYYDSPDNGRPRYDYYPTDYDRYSDYDYSSEYDYSSPYDRSSSPYDRPSSDYDHPSSDYDRPSSDYDRPSSDYDRPSLDYDHPSSDYDRPSSDYDRPSSDYNRPSSDYDRSLPQRHNKPSTQQSGSEKNPQAANKNPFEYIEKFPEEIQKILKALPPPPNFFWSECTGRKKAVCVGINYVGQKDALKGCSNDARNMRTFLMNFYAFKSQDILLLTDDGQPASMKPTRKDMFNAMNWLVEDAKIHDSLFFHYSGHGGQVKDKTGKEDDGMNEVIFPVDFQSTSHIVDDDLFTALVAPLPTGCRLTAVFDSCHSGTVLDLPYLHSAHGRLRSLVHITQRAQQRAQQREAAPSADVICFAACKDDETSADTFQGGVSVGAMSYALLKILKANLDNHTHLTYAQILQKLRDLLIPRFKQKAQISGTHPIDLERAFIL